MSRTLVLLLLLAGCGGAGEASPKPAVPPEAKVATGTAGAVEDGAKAQEKLLAEFREQMNKDARGLLKSFESRVYDPRRESLLDHAEGEVDVRLDGKDAKYRFVYDAANKPNDPVTVEKVAEAAGVDAGQLKRARQWAIVACCGPSAFVAFYVPPTQLVLWPATDAKSKNLVVWAQPFRDPLNVSYGFDERQVIVNRGEWTDEKNHVGTKFDWVDWHGRYLLARSTIVDGAVLDFEYGDRDGVHLLNTVRVSGGAQSGLASFTYKSIRRRAG